MNLLVNSSLFIPHKMTPAIPVHIRLGGVRCQEQPGAGAAPGARGAGGGLEGEEGQGEELPQGAPAPGGPRG